MLPEREIVFEIPESTVRFFKKFFAGLLLLLAVTAKFANMDAALERRKPAPALQHAEEKIKVLVKLGYPRAAVERTVPAALAIAKLMEVDADLVLAVVAVESSFREEAVSKAGAVGLMQVRGDVWGISRRLLKTAEVNLVAGCFILKHYLQRCGGKLECALKKYSATTHNRYVRKVLAIYHMLKQTEHRREETLVRK